MYSSYIVEKDTLTYADAGAVAILLGNSRRTLQNIFLFYPAPDGSGLIGSVAIYGTILEGHKKAIEKSMLIFGLPVESIEWDHEKKHSLIQLSKNIDFDYGYPCISHCSYCVILLRKGGAKREE